MEPRCLEDPRNDLLPCAAPDPLLDLAAELPARPPCSISGPGEHPQPSLVLLALDLVVRSPGALRTPLAGISYRRRAAVANAHAIPSSGSLI